MHEDPRPSTGRSESPEERADRKWAELLQEVRVTQTGVQILFAFLLTVAFTPRFAELGATEKVIYIVTVLLGAAATGALIAPVSLHRFVTGRRLKPETVVWASGFTLAGLVLLLFTVASALLLILRVVASDSVALWLVAAVLLWFALCWFVPAVLLRRRSRKDRLTVRNRSR
ncbi:DUF6328 family protein [Streptomyces coffeae]|uniref:Integral membrane protein n=1 Tax=Streptomyces coffeae TaxID=621382 RepID=A0ABS1NJF6_9ACTN|nr:DUF6328 family protein [Streptomyces coffeae]MBL1100236.1 hypothetical protein [Streptomyces coffeae]